MQEIQAFAGRLDRVREMLPDMRRAALEEAGDEMLAAVRGRIGGTGKVQKWQDRFMGSKGGYAASRPKAKEKDDNGDAVGYVTNAIESGHRVPKPRSTAGRYKFRSRTQDGTRRLPVLTVPGKRMYANTEPDVERIAERTARDVERRLTAALEE